MSLFHAELTVTSEGSVKLVDLGSLNGTWVGDVLVERELRRSNLGAGEDRLDVRFAPQHRDAPAHQEWQNHTRDRHQGGWSSAMEKLDKYLTA